MILSRLRLLEARGNQHRREVMYLIKCIGVIELSREEHGLIVHTISDVLYTRLLILTFLLQSYDHILAVDV